MKSIDSLFNRKFDRDSYHCVHFLIDAGKYLFNYDFGHCFLGLTGSLDTTLRPTKTSMKEVVLVDKPRDGTIMLALTLDNKHHVGLYYCNRFIHLPENGPRFETLRSINRRYKKVKLYDVKDFS